MIEIENIKIEKNIPMPTRTSNRNGGIWKHMADNMDVGDSVFLEKPPKDKKGNINVTSRLQRYKPKKFRCFPEKEGARIWRVK